MIYIMSKEISSSKQKISKMPVYMPGGSWRWFGSNIKDPRFGNPDFKIPKDRQVSTKEILDLVSYQGLGDALEYVSANKRAGKEMEDSPNSIEGGTQASVPSMLPQSIISDHALHKLIVTAKAKPFVTGGAVFRVCNDLLKLKAYIRTVIEDIDTPESQVLKGLICEHSRKNSPNESSASGNENAPSPVTMRHMQ